jgi:hypothetical protein
MKWTNHHQVSDQGGGPDTGTTCVPRTKWAMNFFPYLVSFGLYSLISINILRYIISPSVWIGSNKICECLMPCSSQKACGMFFKLHEIALPPAMVSGDASRDADKIKEKLPLQAASRLGTLSCNYPC